MSLASEDADEMRQARKLGQERARNMGEFSRQRRVYVELVYGERSIGIDIHGILTATTPTSRSPRIVNGRFSVVCCMIGGDMAG
jgi:hypothetical protein